MMNKSDLLSLHFSKKKRSFDNTVLVYSVLGDGRFNRGADDPVLTSLSGEERVTHTSFE